MKFITPLLSLTVLLSHAAAHAGTSQVKLTCRSASGLTSLEADLPGDGHEARLTLTLSGKKDPKTKITTHYINPMLVTGLMMKDENPQSVYPGHKLVTVSVIDRLADLGVYAVDAITRDADFEASTLRLIAKPATVRTKAGAHQSFHATFQATVTGIDPRAETRAELPAIEVACTYDYSV